MSDAPAAPAEGAAAPAPSKPKSKLILIVAAAIVVLAAGGGGGYWWWSHRAPADAAAQEEAEHVEPGIVSFEPFVANLADEGGNRFLRASLKLVIDKAERAKELEENPVERVQVQSAILEVLTVQTADELVTPEGKAELKKTIIERAMHVLHDTKVTDVLFTEFIVQF